MLNKKGFTLVEVMTVVIIIGILAALSVPFLIGYARDARNDRAKSVLYLVAQGYKNFKADFPSALNRLDFSASLEKINNLNQNAINCSLSEIVGSASLDYTALIKCSYIPNLNYGDMNYKFYLGGPEDCCQAATGESIGALACMQGNDTGNYDSSYCAYIDKDNILQESGSQEGYYDKKDK